MTLLDQGIFINFIFFPALKTEKLQSYNVRATWVKSNQVYCGTDLSALKVFTSLDLVCLILSSTQMLRFSHRHKDLTSQLPLV